MSNAVVKDVRSVLIPLSDRQLLLPNAVVAEVMGFQSPDPIDAAPEWYLGDMAWRGIIIPVISFEAMCGGEVARPGHRGRIAILNALGGQPRLSHYGMVVQAIPSLVRVSSDNVIPVMREEVAENPLIRQSVDLDMSPAFIPDLDEIERQIVEISDQL